MTRTVKKELSSDLLTQWVTDSTKLSSFTVKRFFTTTNIILFYFKLASIESFNCLRFYISVFAFTVCCCVLLLWCCCCCVVVIALLLLWCRCTVVVVLLLWCCCCCAVVIALLLLWCCCTVVVVVLRLVWCCCVVVLLLFMAVGSQLLTWFLHVFAFTQSVDAECVLYMSLCHIITY